MLLLRALLLALLCYGSQAEGPPIPKYKRGPVPDFMIPLRDRENGVVYWGPRERLRVAMHKLQTGKQLKIAVIGGSNTVGHGAYNGSPWPNYLFNWLEDTFPGKASVHNGAMPGTTSAYMATCANVHVPQDAELIIVEYAHNDLHDANPPMRNDDRTAYEKLIRKLLAYQHHPAVLLLHTYVWHEADPPFKGAFWRSAERDFHVFEQYYQLPAVSVKACCYHLMRTNISGFRIDVARRNGNPIYDFETFYGDAVHGCGDTGYRVMGELFIHVFMQTLAELKEHPLTEEEFGYATAPLPPPMIPGAYPSLSDKCFLGDHLTKTVISREGWDWLDESPGGKRRPKWGFIATKAGAQLRLKVDTSVVGADPSLKVNIQLAHLRSYEKMGTAQVQCESGCKCTSTVIDGHDGTRKVSQMHLHSFEASQSPECVISVTVLEETKSGERKVKVQGIFVSDARFRVLNNERVMDTIQDLAQGDAGVMLTASIGG